MPLNFWTDDFYSTKTVARGPLTTARDQVTSQPAAWPLQPWTLDGVLDPWSEVSTFSHSTYVEDTKHSPPLIDAGFAVSEQMSSDPYYDLRLSGSADMSSSLPLLVYSQSETSSSSASSPSHASPGPNHQSRHERRREQNRRAQIIFRQKRKDEVRQLQAEVMQLKAQLVEATITSQQRRAAGFDQSAFVVCSLCKSYAGMCN